MMNSNGFIKLHRKLIDWGWFTFPDTLQLFIYCLLKANHKAVKWQDIEVKRGEFVTSFTAIEKDTKLTSRKIRTSMNRLKSTSEMTSRTTNKFTIITVCNYDTYQGSDSDERQAERQAYRQSNDKQPSTNKNDKNEKNIKERKILKDFSGCSFVRNDFREVFKMWLDFKAEKKKSYKGEKSAELCYKKLISLSGGSAEVARKIVEQSMSNNWDGLFELSTTNKITEPEPTIKGVKTWKAE